MKITLTRGEFSYEKTFCNDFVRTVFGVTARTALFEIEHHDFDGAMRFDLHWEQGQFVHASIDCIPPVRKAVYKKLIELIGKEDCTLYVKCTGLPTPSPRG